MDTNTPNGINVYYARSAAHDIAEKLTATIHLELLNTDFANGMAKHHRQEAWEQLETLAGCFGAGLVEYEQEPEPLDAETVARREGATEQHIIDAGRGHLVGG